MRFIKVTSKGKGWRGEHRRHREAALKGIRNREFKRLARVGIRNIPVLGDTIEKYEDTKTVVKSVKRIANTYN